MAQPARVLDAGIVTRLAAVEQQLALTVLVSVARKKEEENQLTSLKSRIRLGMADTF